MSGVGTWTMRMSVSQSYNDGYESGLALFSADSAAVTHLRLRYVGSSSAYIGVATNNNSYADVGNAQLSAGGNGGPLILRVVNDGTNWTYATAPAAGAQGSFTVLTTIPVSAMATLTQIGPYVDAWDQQAANSPAVLTMSGWSHTTATDVQAAMQ